MPKFSKMHTNLRYFFFPKSTPKFFTHPYTTYICTYNPGHHARFFCQLENCSTGKNEINTCFTSQGIIYLFINCKQKTH